MINYKKKEIIILSDGSEKIIERDSRFQSSWTFSIYNIYNRKNPYFIYFALEGDEGTIQEGNLDPKAYQVSIFPIIPSVTWNFSF